MSNGAQRTAAARAAAAAKRRREDGPEPAAVLLAGLLWLLGLGGLAYAKFSSSDGDGDGDDDDADDEEGGGGDDDDEGDEDGGDTDDPDEDDGDGDDDGDSDEDSGDDEEGGGDGGDEEGGDGDDDEEGGDGDGGGGGQGDEQGVGNCWNRTIPEGTAKAALDETVQWFGLIPPWMSESGAPVPNPPDGEYYGFAAIRRAMMLLGDWQPEQGWNYWPGTGACVIPEGQESVNCCEFRDLTQFLLYQATLEAWENRP